MTIKNLAPQTSSTQLLQSPNDRVLKLNHLKKPGLSTGIYFDSHSVLAAMISCGRKGEVNIEALEKISGTFNEPQDLIRALLQIQDRLPRGIDLNTVSCVTEGQIYVAQKSIPACSKNKMNSVITHLVQKEVNFNLETATWDYQILTKIKAKKIVEIIVTAVETPVLNHHLDILNRAGYEPKTVEVLPLCLANGLWATIQQPQLALPYVLLHVGVDFCTLVITGYHTPFYYKPIFTSRDQIQIELKTPEKPTPGLKSLLSEITKSLNHYSHQNQISRYAGILHSGYTSDFKTWNQWLATQTSLEVVPLDMVSHCGFDLAEFTGEFDMPLILALRGQS